MAALSHEVEGNTVPQPSVPIGGGPEGVRLRRQRNGIRTKFWCWTLNNYTDEQEAELKNAVDRQSGVKYIVFGKEVGEQGTPHLQGYAELSGSVIRNAAKKTIGPHCFGMHLEPRLGTADEAITYCKKDGDWFEAGTVAPGPGKRTDLDSLYTELESGADMQSVSNSHFQLFLRYNRGIGMWLSLNQKREPRKCPRIHWMYGPSGSGKSTSARRLASEMEEDYFTVSTSPTGTWWGGYSGQKVVVLDDLRAGWFPHNVILRLFDSCQMTVPYHGGQAPLKAQTWIVTTNDPPHMLYQQDPCGALARRVEDFATVYHVKKDCTKIVSKPKFDYGQE